MKLETTTGSFRALFAAISCARGPTLSSVQRKPLRHSKLSRPRHWKSENISASFRALYRREPDNVRASFRALYRRESDNARTTFRALYRRESDNFRVSFNALYRRESDNVRASFRCLLYKFDGYSPLHHNQYKLNHHMGSRSIILAALLAALPRQLRQVVAHVKDVLITFQSNWIERPVV